MKLLKKLLQNIFCISTYEVENVDSHIKELATSYQLLGFTYKITYKPV